MSGPKPTRSQGDLAEMLETLLDKGVVINADVAVTVGETELLSIHLRAAVASFETAAAYGLEFPSGTDEARVAEAAGVDPLAPESDGETTAADPDEATSTVPGRDTAETTVDDSDGDAGTSTDVGADAPEDDR